MRVLDGFVSSPHIFYEFYFVREVTVRTKSFLEQTEELIPWDLVVNALPTFCEFGFADLGCEQGFKYIEIAFAMLLTPSFSNGTWQL